MVGSLSWVLQGASCTEMTLRDEQERSIDKGAHTVLNLVILLQPPSSYRHREISACHSFPHILVHDRKGMQEKAKLVLRLTKDAVPSHHTTIDEYPDCKRILSIYDHRNQKAIPVPRSEAIPSLSDELNRAPRDICERVYEAFGVSGYDDLFPMSSIPDLEEDGVSEAPEDYEEEEEGRVINLKLSSDTKNKKSSSSLRDSPQVRSRSTGKSTSAHKTAATDTAKPRIPNQVPISTFWNYVEAFFKPIDEADIKYLDDPTMPVDATAFVIPPLGRRYETQWRELYGFIVQTKGKSVEDSLPLPELLPKSTQQNPVNAH